MDDIRIDGNVLMFTAAISLLTAVLFGMAPALRTAGQDLNRTLRASASLSPTRAQLKLRSILVIAEIALALVLLVGAGLLMRSFVRLQQVQPGFDHARVLTFRIALPFAGHPPDVRLAFIKETERRLRALPGVTDVGFTAQIPLTGSGPLRPYAFNEETARNWESETSDLPVRLSGVLRRDGHPADRGPRVRRARPRPAPPRHRRDPRRADLARAGRRRQDHSDPAERQRG